MPDRYGITGENLTLLEKDEFLLNYMPHMDFVIARAGFNTISECVAARVPLLLIGEASNPEMEMNMLFVKQEGIGSFVSLQNFADRLRADDTRVRRVGTRRHPPTPPGSRLRDQRSRGHR